MNCVICIEPLGNKKLVSTNCGHVFHKDCLETSIKKGNNRCPTCTTRMGQRSLRQVYGLGDGVAQGPIVAPIANVVAPNVNILAAVPIANVVAPIVNIPVAQIAENVVENAVEADANEQSGNVDENAVEADANEQSRNVDENGVEKSRSTDENEPTRNLDKNGAHADELIAAAQPQQIKAARRATRLTAFDDELNPEDLSADESTNNTDGMISDAAAIKEKSVGSAQPIVENMNEIKTTQEVTCKEKEIDHSTPSVVATQQAGLDISDAEGNKANQPSLNTIASETLNGSSNVDASTIDQQATVFSAAPGTSRVSFVTDKPKGKRKVRSKSIHVDKNVRLLQNPRKKHAIDSVPVERRSSRIVKGVHHYNYGMVRCFVCNKTFRQDISIDHYHGPIVCSFECLKQNI